MCDSAFVLLAISLRLEIIICGDTESKPVYRDESLCSFSKAFLESPTYSSGDGLIFVWFGLSAYRWMDLTKLNCVLTSSNARRNLVVGLDVAFVHVYKVVAADY